MKTVKTRFVYTNPKEMRKNIRFVTIAFFMISLFITLINIQSFSVLLSPSKLVKYKFYHFTNFFDCSLWLWIFTI